MSDTYFARYQHLSHQELYDMLQAGSPAQLLAISDNWRHWSEQTNDLSVKIANDLAALGNTWHGESGLEFQRRLESVAGFAYLLSTEYGQVSTATSTMSAHLREAQQSAENPADINDNHMMQQATSNATTFAWGGPGVALIAGGIGALQGHSQDQEEQEKAHQRMIGLVTGLAAEYEQATDTGLSLDLPAPPDELPGSIIGWLIGDVIGAALAAMAGAAGQIASGGAFHSGTATVSSPNRPPGPAPAPAPVSEFSGLSGAGELSGADEVQLGVGGVGYHPKPTVGEVGVSATALLGAGGLTVTGLAATAASARSGAPAFTTPTSGAAGASAAPRPSVGADSVLGREVDNPAGRGVGAANRPLTGTTGRGHDEEPDEHTTWLTEDDMDWGGEDAAPPVLGERVDDGGDDTRRNQTSG